MCIGSGHRQGHGFAGKTRIAGHVKHLGRGRTAAVVIQWEIRQVEGKEGVPSRNPLAIERVRNLPHQLRKAISALTGSEQPSLPGKMAGRSAR